MKKLKIYLVHLEHLEYSYFISAYNSRQARSIFCKELNYNFNETEAEIWKPKEDWLYHYFEDENIPATMNEQEIQKIIENLSKPRFAPF